MDTQLLDIPNRVLKWIEAWISTQKVVSPVVLEPLAGDGSTRRFFRLKLLDCTKILLYDPKWLLSRDYAAHQTFLQSKKLPVPHFEAVEPELGCLIMEDLGNESLQQRILSNPKQKIHWLSQASRLAAQIHGRTFPVTSDIPAADRRFDTQKFKEELLFTLEHLSNKLLKLAPLTPPQEKILTQFCSDLEQLAPIGFSHRDFHSRNLYLSNEKIIMIDFQDARLGPPHYDLASLVYDAYVPLSQEERKKLCEVYQKEMKSYPLSKRINWDSFEVDLEVVAFQRLIKAAGSFASFFTRYKKTTHLPYLLPALENALYLSNKNKETFSKYSDLFNIQLWIEKIGDERKIAPYLRAPTETF